MADAINYEAAKLWAQRKLEQDAAEAAGQRGLVDKALGLPMDAWRSIRLSADSANTDFANQYGSDRISPADAARNIYDNMKTSQEARKAMQSMATSGLVNMPLGYDLRGK